MNFDYNHEGIRKALLEAEFSGVTSHEHGGSFIALYKDGWIMGSYANGADLGFWTELESFFKPIAADAKTLDGVTPYLAIIDEYHEANSKEKNESLTTWLAEVPPGKIVEALGRPATNSSRDKARMMKRAAEIEEIAKRIGAKIEVRFYRCA